MITQELQQDREAWGRIAAGYDQFVTPTETWLANEALTRARVTSGERFLDVAAGCGGLSVPAARLGAKVMATDWSPTMIQLLAEFQVSDPEVLRQRLIDAGLTSVTVDAVTERLEFRSGQELWNWVLNGNPLAEMLVASQTEEQRRDARAVLDGMLRERSGGNEAAVLTNPVHIGIGTK